MATHSSILAWETPWTEEPGGYMPVSHKESDTTEQLSTVQHRGSRVVKTKPAVNNQAARSSLLARTAPSLR